MKGIVAVPMAILHRVCYVAFVLIYDNFQVIAEEGSMIDGARIPDTVTPFRTPVCADIMLLFDTSCSIIEPDKERIIDVVKRFYSAINSVPMDDTSEGSVRLGAATFSKGIGHQFFLNDNIGSDAILSALSSTNMSDLGCKTHTHHAIESLYTTYFGNSSLGDRDDAEYPNVALIFTDSRSFPKRNEKKAIANAAIAKEKGIHIGIVLVPNKFGKPPREKEVEMVPSDPVEDNTYDIDNDELIEELNGDMSRMFPCPPIMMSDERVCADVLFIFDISCSIMEAHKQASLQVAREIVQLVVGDVRYSAMTYDEDAYLQFSSSEHGGNIQAVLDDLTGMDMAEVNCKTKTHSALAYTLDFVFNDNKSIDRDDKTYPDIVILFNDGLTAPLKERDRTIEAARALKNNGIDIFLVKLWNNRGKDGRPEFQAIPTFQEYLLPGINQGFLDDDPRSVAGVADNIAMQLNRYQCPT
ncbi:unnamed protein product [Owenia fusiformis]|uniref:Uncharacterized protein n=1 Tax=Owenia fusiformis TaxID=6347 RepID=A0A8J1XRV7_OWEFU|nr:unnamed protein product [Owenia fusiformis]